MQDTEEIGLHVSLRAFRCLYISSMFMRVTYYVNAAVDAVVDSGIQSF